MRRSIFDEPPGAVLCCPVNCVGVMGAGLAKQFARIYPDIVAPYKAACKSGELRIGRCLIIPSRSHRVAMVPTKRHWRQPSRIDDVRRSVASLREVLEAAGSPPVAIPALGCGLGGLEWSAVKSILSEELAGYSGAVTLYPPR